MATKLLLLDDVGDLGRSGDVVSVKPGFARNYLLPKRLAVVAEKNTLRMQVRLREERQVKAAEDQKESQAVAKRLEDVTLTATVKVDQDGHMYGSVSTLDIVHMLIDQQKMEVDKRSIQLKHPIKTTGIHNIELKLPEGVMAKFILKVLPEETNGTKPPVEDKGEKVEEEKSEETTE